MTLNNSAEGNASEFYLYRQVNANKTGQEYKAFVRSLKQKYWIVWRDIALGYFALILVLSALSFDNENMLLNIVVTIIGAIAIGYLIHYLTLFIHEAAHHNIAKGSLNDTLATYFLCWFAGVDIAKYRLTHFQHHRLHGTCRDTENSYFNAPSLIFLLKTLLGLHAVHILLNRKKQDKSSMKFYIPIKFVFVLLVHISLLLIFYFYFPWMVLIAWLFGLFSFFPFFSTMRQILEHRDIEANPTINYYLQPHGSLSRIFGNDFFSATFGGAGFNRHLLHHLEPNVPYTRLTELEVFLLRTNVAPLIEARRSSYWAVLIKLLKKNF